jgi:hypothetical protein
MSYKNRVRKNASEGSNPPLSAGDLKKQECVYAISQAQDGSLVVSGNSSHNFDDCMLLKTYSPCQQDLAFDTSADLIVNSNTTWSTNKIIGHNIIIDNNSTLTIDGATIEFGDYQQLGRMIGVHIKPGAKLKLINGAKLTSVQNCNDSKWLGINVYGNKSLSQTESNQGTIEIVGTASNPVVIENADDAISTRGFTSYTTNNMDWNSFGGIIKATPQSVATESITLLHFEIEILFWLLSEDTENTEVLELYVIPNVCSEYSEQN